MIPLFVAPFSVTDWVWLAGFLSLDFLLPVGLNGFFAVNSFSGFCFVCMAWTAITLFFSNCCIWMAKVWSLI